MQIYPKFIKILSIISFSCFVSSIICNTKRDAEQIIYLDQEFSSLPFTDIHTRGRHNPKNLTDALFSRTSPEMAGKIYEIMKITDEIFTRHKITYWAIGGTSLGVERHKGLIPWDDDGDWMIFEKARNKIITLIGEFANYGLKITPIREIYKIAFSEDNNYPALDIFTCTKNRNQIISTSKYFAKKDFWNLEELFPLIRRPFGPIKIMCPKKNLRYLKNKYGSDCMNSGVYWNHAGVRIKQKVKIVDRNPAPYISVHPNIHLS